MKQVIILMGLPASGKSTFANEFVKKHKDWVRVNKDQIRLETEFDGPWYKKEKLVHSKQCDLIRQYLDDGKNVIIDNTHLNPVTMEDTKRFVDANGGKVVKVLYFPTDVAEAIKRDRGRAASVGSHVIMKMYNAWVATGKMPQDYETYKAD